MRKESPPTRPTLVTGGGAMFVLQYFCSRVTKQVSAARTSAGPAVRITYKRKEAMKKPPDSWFIDNISNKKERKSLRPASV